MLNGTISWYVQLLRLPVQLHPSQLRPVPHPEEGKTAERQAQAPIQAPATPDPPPAPPPRVLRKGDKALVVQEGDTLWDISQAMKVPVENLVKANNGMHLGFY